VRPGLISWSQLRAAHGPAARISHRCCAWSRNPGRPWTTLNRSTHAAGACSLPFTASRDGPRPAGYPPTYEPNHTQCSRGSGERAHFRFGAAGARCSVIINAGSARQVDADRRWRHTRPGPAPPPAPSQLPAIGSGRCAELMASRVLQPGAVAPFRISSSPSGTALAY
jgi:hypothetical protein